MNIAWHMQRAGNVHARESAVALGTEPQLDYSELAARVASLAAALRTELNLETGQRVAIFSKNCVEYLEILFAAWHAGLVIVPINAKLHVNEAAYILSSCDASVCFSQSSTVPELASVADGCQIVAVGGAAYEALLQSEPMEVLRREPDDPAWIFYTSGTTGPPKGATLSFRNLMTMSYCYLTDVDPEAPWAALLHAAPMSHGSGLIAIAYVMQGGCHIVPVSQGYDTEEVLGLIEAWPHVSFFAAPTMVKRLTEYPHDTDTKNLKVIVYGGGPMYLEHCVAALKKFGPKLSQLYGQGESPMTITALNRLQHARKDGDISERLSSVGTAQSAVEVRIVDSDRRGLPFGEIGEVTVRGDTVMLGYWGNEEATQRTIQDGWLHTGDHGVLNEDGYLTLKDRSKDLIISGGSNIYPREVEEVLLTSELVADVSIIGRADEEWGEIVVAYIVLNDARSETDRAALDKVCTDQIARFKRPKVYRFVDALPKNNYGKILKSELRKFDAESLV